MSTANELKEKILKIARERKADRFKPLSISDLINDLGEVSKESLNYALMILMGEGKIVTTGAGSNLSIVSVSKK